MEDRAGRGTRSRDPFDQRIDQWVETGRQFVDGVSGRRPGQRRGGLALDSVGRWVGDKVEWLLDDDEDWREPWQAADRPPVNPPDRSQARRPLDAISRRGRPVSSQQPAPGMGVMPDDNDQSWPEDDSFRVQRWERSRAESGEPQVGPSRSRPSARRSLPRSSRRRD